MEIDWDHLDEYRTAYHQHLNACPLCDEERGLCTAGEALRRRALQLPPTGIDTVQLVPED